MRKLPLFLATIICTIWLTISLPILFILWLLGGDSPFIAMVDMLSEILNED